MKSTKQYLKDILRGIQEELILINALDDEKTSGPSILYEFLLCELIDPMNLAPHARSYLFFHTHLLPRGNYFSLSRVKKPLNIHFF